MRNIIVVYLSSDSGHNMLWPDMRGTPARVFTAILTASLQAGGLSATLDREVR